MKVVSSLPQRQPLPPTGPDLSPARRDQSPGEGAGGEDPPAVVLVSGQARVVEVVSSIAASVGVEVRVLTARQQVEDAWQVPGPLLVGDDHAADLVGWGLPERAEVHIVGEDAGLSARWSAVLGASVIVVPGAAAVLAEVLRERVGQRDGAVVVRVSQVCGGLGASSLALGLGWAVARAGGSAAVVEVDGDGSGLDVLAGIEDSPGWRWPELASARGVVSDLHHHLPGIDGVTLVSAGRREVEVTDQARAAVLGSLCADFDVVVVDGGNGAAPWHRQLRVDRHLTVVAAEPGALMVARRRGGGSVVLRRGRGRRVSAAEAADALGVAPLAVIEEDRRLPRAHEYGEAPWVMASRRWRRAVAGIAEAVTGRGGQ